MQPPPNKYDHTIEEKKMPLDKWKRTCILTIASMYYPFCIGAGQLTLSIDYCELHIAIY